MPTSGLIAAFLFGLVVHHEWVRSRTRRCDACRIERDGGTLGMIPHTCSRRRALHRDRKGIVREFGKRVRSE